MDTILIHIYLNIILNKRGEKLKQKVSLNYTATRECVLSNSKSVTPKLNLNASVASKVASNRYIFEYMAYLSSMVRLKSYDRKLCTLNILKPKCLEMQRLCRGVYVRHCDVT